MRNPPTAKSVHGPPEDDLDTLRPVATAMAVSGMRKKGAAGIRAWLLLDASGQAQVVEVGKHAIMRRTGLPARDLRILDPLLSYPSTVLGRERAIVINLEHIKAIITAQEVLLLNSKDPSVTPFVEELQRRIIRHHRDTKHMESQINGKESEWANLSGFKESRSRDVSPQGFFSRFPNSPPNSHGRHDEYKVEGNVHHENRDSLKVLPFEFVALEACLEAACSCLDSEARTLEQEAHPALDKLTSKISTLNLERVRQIKSRLVAITGRVQKVRDELEHLLDDDEDMAEMYLTDKLLQQQQQQQNENCSVSCINDKDGVADDGAVQPDTYTESRIGPEISLEGKGNLVGYVETQEQLFSGSNAISRDGDSISKDVDLDVEELEMLLEAYFVEIDGTLNKLSTLREYVDDTEDYINIMLDDKQNHLLQMGVMLTTATLVVSAFVVVAGIFGMNINIDLFKEGTEWMHGFLWTVGGGATGTIFLYCVAIAWCKQKHLLE